MNPNFVRMPEMGTADPDELFVCPYDPVHRVAAKRFPYHLMKCRKNWGGRSMTTCPFNARHIVPQPEFRHHVANCPDKAMIEQDMAYLQRKENLDGSYVKGCTDIPAYNRKIPSPTEDWDREISISDMRMGYNQDEHLAPNMIRNLTGYTPAEKREYHRATGKFHFKTQEDVESHIPGAISPDPKQPSHPIHTPTAVYQNGTAPSTAQPQSTASGTTLPCTNSHQMRLPKQLPKAAGVAAAAAAASVPDGREYSVSKRGGRAIAANIFGASSHAYPSAETMATPHPVSTPLADSEYSANLNGYSKVNHALPNGVNHQPSSAFNRPLPGVGRGLIPGLGRGMVPGIGRGLVSFNNALSLQAMAGPKVGGVKQEA